MSLASQQPTHRKRKREQRSLPESLSIIGNYTIGWAAPTEQVRYLKGRGDEVMWVGFRDGFMSKWTNLNIVCGLIMGAISTVMFAGIELDPVTFGFGITSLLSSLISIGFGTGLMYVHGDVHGLTLDVWAGVCIVTFFLCVGVFAWNATDKGWTAKAGIIGSSVLTAIHIALFARLSYKQHKVESLIADGPETGIDDNIHLVNFRKSASDTQSVNSTPPRPKPFVTQHGGSGVGHYRSSPQERHFPGQPLVESPDPSSQIFPTSHSSQRSPSGRVRMGSNEDMIVERPMDLLAASERLVAK